MPSAVLILFNAAFALAITGGGLLLTSKTRLCRRHYVSMMEAFHPRELTEPLSRSRVYLWYLRFFGVLMTVFGVVGLAVCIRDVTRLFNP